MTPKRPHYIHTPVLSICKLLYTDPEKIESSLALYCP